MKKIKYICLCFTALFLTTSCEKLVEVGVPTNALVTTTVFKNDGTAISAQLSIYATLINFLRQYDQVSGLSSDELINYSSKQINVDFYHNSLTAQNEGGANGFWSGLYKIIYQENAILENIKISESMSDRVKNLLRGEALFTRAFSHFQLINMFGDVPLVLTTDYSKTATQPRTSKEEVYNQIAADLEEASGLLSENYIDENDNPGSTERVRPTSWAAKALLARIYLYMKKFDLAEQRANSVVANTILFSLPSDLNQVFKKNSTETIWQMTPPNTSKFTQEGNSFILTNPPGNTNPNGAVYSISQQLLGAFEPGDQRLTKWIKSYTQISTGITWYYPYKYKDNNTSSALSEYSMVLRLAEQYLIRAEARVQQGKLVGSGSAAEDLNIIRNRAGLMPTTATSSTDLLTAIAHERQMELFTENDRWYDLKRTKKIDAVMTVVTPQKGGGSWQSYQQLYPIAVSDLQYNPNLQQNPGY